MFKLPKNVVERSNSRENVTYDIAKRLSVITSNRIHIKRFPICNPVAVFNPSMIVNGDEILVYARIVLGYYTYASAVAEIRMSMEDLFDSISHYSAELVIYPSWKYDIWGVEDPRVVEVNGKLFLTYCGRTVSYFDPHVRVERTVPITAVREKEGWRKLCVHRFPEDIRRYVVSDKDAFLVNSKNGLKLFHRPHMRDEKFYLTVSDVDVICEGCEESVIRNTRIILNQAKFEEKIGWGTPPVEVEKEYLFLLHGLERESKAYKVFALTMNSDLEITAITPYYIMEPRAIYEVFGDRPFVVFPCGSQIVDDKLIVSYGSADFAIGFCEIDLSELMSILDQNRFD
jgi:predicted GH43/DUF377 family glycosyl hydrolase